MTQVSYLEAQVKQGDLNTIRSTVGEVCLIIEPLIKYNEQRGKDRAIEQRDALSCLQKFANQQEGPAFLYVNEIGWIVDMMDSWYLILYNRSQNKTGVVETEWQWVLMTILLEMSRAVKAIMRLEAKELSANRNECILACTANLSDAVLFRLPHLAICLPDSLLTDSLLLIKASF